MVIVHKHLLFIIYFKSVKKIFVWKLKAPGNFSGSGKFFCRKLFQLAYHDTISQHSLQNYPRGEICGV